MAAVRKLIVLILVLSVLAAAKSKRDKAIEEVAKAERDFARMSVAQGTRAAFFANFTEDGISFGPQPAPLRKVFGPPPDPSTPRKNVLDWYPTWTDASHSGDFAFSTGPSVTTDKSTGKPIRWGNFASVWRKQNDGTWKVVIDIGIQHAEPPPGSEQKWSAGKESKYKPLQSSNDEEALTLFERQFANGKQPVTAYSAVVTDESRLHRPGMFPMLGKNAILEHFEKSADAEIGFQPTAAVIAPSGDLAYTYGSYIAQPGDKKGFYAHFWKREKNGDWKLVIDVTNPAEAK
jgi:ketosteroid isomerase-like protein